MDIPTNRPFSSPSDEFMEAVCHSGTGYINCDLCGRVHFAPDAGYDWSEGELEGLLEKAKTDPKKYINYGDESISWGVLDGKQVVWGCPCNRARAYEELFWRSRYVIEEYFRKKAELASEKAKTQARIAKAVTSAVEP